MQRLQPNFMTDGIRNFMYTKHKEDSAKLYRSNTTYNTILWLITELLYITSTMETTTRTTKTTTSTSNKTFNALTTETTRILGYSYSNFAIKRQG